MQIQYAKRIDSLFKIVKKPQESFELFVDRFKAALNLIVNPSQIMTHVTFIKGLMHDLVARIHSIPEQFSDGHHIKKYQDAYPIIFRFLKLEALRGTCSFSNQENVCNNPRTRAEFFL